MKAIYQPLFSDSSLNRATKKREIPSEINSLRQDRRTKHTLIWQGKLLFDISESEPKIGYLKKTNKFWNKFPYSQFDQGSFLGYWKETAIFYHDISKWNGPDKILPKLNEFLDDTEQHHESLPDSYVFRNLRSNLNILSKSEASILATIKGIYEWRVTNQYCNFCGNPTKSMNSGWEKVCTACHSKHFPRTDPVVIMLVCRENKTLLGRSKAWPQGMFSCLAGFMEPGESIEVAVARETYEEAGINVQNTRYITSQPWPFPASLMIGCYTEADSYDLKIDNSELEDARWFSKKDVATAMNNKASWWPARKGSIARLMIQTWLKNGV